MQTLNFHEFSFQSQQVVFILFLKDSQLRKPGRKTIQSRRKTRPMTRMRTPKPPRSQLNVAWFPWFSVQHASHPLTLLSYWKHGRRATKRERGRWHPRRVISGGEVQRRWRSTEARVTKFWMYWQALEFDRKLLAPFQGLRQVGGERIAGRTDEVGCCRQ